MRLGSKLSASEAYGRGTSQGIHAVQALTRYQRAHNGKRRRRQRIMPGTWATPLTTAKQPGHTPQCRDEWPLYRHALSGYVSSIRNINQRERRPWIRYHASAGQAPAHRVQVLPLQGTGYKQQMMELHGHGLQCKLSLSSASPEFDDSSSCGRDWYRSSALTHRNLFQRA